MHRRVAVPLTALVVAGAVAVPATTALAATSRAAIAGQVRHAFRHSTAGRIAYEFRISGVGTIRHAADHRSAPASNEKLLTAVTLLQRVGSTFHYVTPAFAHGDIENQTLHGSLVVRGSGDPSLTRHDLGLLAISIEHDGIRKVTGDLVVDDSRYAHRTIARGWKHSFVPEESGPVSAFTVDRNEWRHGASYDADPTPANAGLLRAALSRHHVHIAGRTRVARVRSGLQLIASHTSGALSQMTDHMLTVSDNFYAEMLLREAGAQRSGHGNLQTGVAAVRAQARRLNVSLGSVNDGSGLSYDDRESPASLVRWLAAAARLDSYPTLFAGLPIGCRTGTLESRLCAARTRGVVHAKTGTLDGVNALSGWTTTAGGHLVTFSVLLSGVRNPSTAIRRIDAAVTAISRSH